MVLERNCLFRPKGPAVQIARAIGLDITHIFSMRTQPQRGFTTKPGVAVTTAHPRKNRTKSSEPQRGSTLPGQFFRFSFSIGGCETPLGFGVIPISLPGVRRNAATPGFVVKPFQG